MTEKKPLISQMQELMNQGRYRETIKLFHDHEMGRIAFLFLAGNASFHAAIENATTPHEAIEYFNKAVNHYSEVIHSANLLGAAGMEEAVEVETRALCNRAITYKKLSKEEEAASDFTKALSLIPPQHREELLRWDKMYGLSPQE